MRHESSYSPRNRALFLALALLALLPHPLASQSAQPTFVAISIKPCPPGSHKGVDFRIRPGGRLVVTNVSLRKIIESTFSLKPFQVGEGWPPWLDDERFNIDAVAEGNPSRTEMLSMLQTALAERCHLKSHWTTSIGNEFALVVENRGPKLTPSVAQKSQIQMLRNDPPPEKDETAVTHTLAARKTSMNSFADYLSGMYGIERPVIDATNLTGEYDFDMTYSEDPNSGTSLLAAIKDQLGLRLEAKKGQITKLNIDNIQRPSPN